MPHDNLILRTVYIDPDLDDALIVEAKSTNTSKAVLFRRYLKAGQAVSSVDDRRILQLPEVVLVLRTVYIELHLDDLLRVQAFDERIPKNNLVRHYLRLGMSL